MKWSTSRANAPRRQTGAAAEIDRALEERRPARAGAHRQHRLEQQCRTAIAEIAHQRCLEPRRVLIEQGLHIGLRHRRHSRGAEPHQAQAGAVPVVRIGRAGPAKRGDRFVALAELFAEFPKGEPGGCKIRASSVACSNRSAAATGSPFNCRSRANSNRRSAIMSPEDRNRRAGIFSILDPRFTSPRWGEVGGTRSVPPGEGLKSLDRSRSLTRHAFATLRRGDLSPDGER